MNDGGVMLSRRSSVNETTRGDLRDTAAGCEERCIQMA